MKYLGMSLIVLFLCGAGTICSANSSEEPAFGAMYQSASGERFAVDQYLVGTHLIRLDLVDASDDLKGRVFVRKPSAEWFVVHHSCSVGDKPDANVIAIARYSERDPILTQIAMAFLVDVENGRIVAIDSKNVTCINDSYGV